MIVMAIVMVMARVRVMEMESWMEGGGEGDRGKEGVR